MASFRAALIQLTSSDDPAENLPRIEALLREAAAGGAQIALTPEVSNILSSSRTRQAETLTTEAADTTLARLREVAAETGLWLSIGSLALLSEEAEGFFANRQFLIAPDGAIVARYDKIHMFDVTLGGEESYRESASYRPGDKAVVAETPFGVLGLTICYDMRFPALYRALAEAGAAVITVPAAFTVPTGRAHWEVLLRARAVETGCFILAAAQVGTHATTRGRVRQTWGHSLAVSPWGEIIAEADGESPGITYAEIDTAEVENARSRVPSLANARAFAAPGT